LELKCYLCDSELKEDAKPFKIGMKEELICASCYRKTVNRRAAADKEKQGDGA
jgi:hypothetical protein